MGALDGLRQWHHYGSILESLREKESQAIMQEALALMDEHEYDVDSQAVLSLVARSNCSAYDCEFMALAQELGTNLVTVDKQILKAFPSVAVSLEAFVSSQAS